MLKILVIASFICIVFSTTGKSQNCTIVEVVPFMAKDNRVDKFSLSKPVVDRFKSYGYLIEGKDSNSACNKFRCEISHTEHYGQMKRDTVTLTLYDASDFLIGRYTGITREMEWTLKEGFTKALNEALDKIKTSETWK